MRLRTLAGFHSTGGRNAASVACEILLRIANTGAETQDRAPAFRAHNSLHLAEQPDWVRLVVRRGDVVHQPLDLLVTPSARM